MKIGIIGAGFVGGRLGVRWARAGHEVVYGTRDPRSEKIGALLREAPARAALHRDAARGAEVVVMALPWAAVVEVAPELGDLAGRVVIDATNRVGGPPSPRSAAEDLAATLPGARVVKTLNTIGAENYARPAAGGVAAAMLLAGDDADAKRVAADLVADLGFAPLDAGPLSQAGALEALAVAWIRLSRSLGRDFALHVLKPLEERP